LSGVESRAENASPPKRCHDLKAACFGDTASNRQIRAKTTGIASAAPRHAARDTTPVAPK
jgi:hypothetical protein